MVLGAEISHQELVEYSTEEKENAVRDAFDMEDEEIDEIRSQRYIRDKALKAAETLSEKGYNQQITGYNIAALVYDEWDNPSSKASCINQSLRREYKDERDAIEELNNLKITYTHLLREDAGAYEGNLLEARRHYEQFENSNDDLLRSVQLPTEIGMPESELLGTFWRDGHFYTDSGRQKFRIEGIPSDKEFYKNIVNDIESIHNLATKIESTEIEKAGNLIEVPTIDLESNSVVTWMADDLNMNSESNISLPELSWNREQKGGFIKGSIAASGGITKYGAYNVSSSSFRYIESMSSILDDLDIEHNQMNTSTRGTDQKKISIPKEQVQQLHELDFFTNPRHKERIDEILTQ